MASSSNTSRFPRHNPNWNEHFDENACVQTTFIGTQGYYLKLRTAKYVANNCGVVAYVLVTNQPITKDRCCGHPFEYVEFDDISITVDTNELVIGEINADNIVMDALFKLIMQDDSTLSSNSGMTEVHCYRSKLIKQLHDLWD